MRIKPLIRSMNTKAQFQKKKLKKKKSKKGEKIT